MLDQTHHSILLRTFLCILHSVSYQVTAAIKYGLLSDAMGLIFAPAMSLCVDVIERTKPSHATSFMNDEVSTYSR